MSQPIPPTAAIAALNAAFEADPAAVNNLFACMTFCNRELADHPTIQCGSLPGDRYWVRTLGMINGALEAMGIGRIAAQYNDDGIIVGFQEYVES